MEWLENLNNAIAYIEHHLDKDISIETAARIACCSPHYFRRMFSYAAGVSLSEYIRRRKMSQAAFALRRTGRKVIDVALQYGYASPTAFNRAFRKVHGISPVAARDPENVLTVYPPLRFSVTAAGRSALTYRIAQKETLHLVGIRAPFRKGEEESEKNITAFRDHTLREKYFSDLCRLSGRHPSAFFRISVCESPETFSYCIAAASDTDTPVGMTAYDIPTATWAVFPIDGHLRESIPHASRRFSEEWLPSSGYRSAGLPTVEIYPVVSGKPAYDRGEVWFAIERKEGDII